ncbi:MAG: hypothetical protein FWC62_00555 [Firmicutes bacterium]|nr:hypothetical protein [Bacillota bacterium]
MSNQLRRDVRNSELEVAKNKRAFLTFPAEGLANCTLEEAEDGVTFVFDTAGLTPISGLSRSSLEEKCRFLVNCAALEELCAEYDFSLSPDNLLMDINLRPRVLIRDARREDSAFLPEYKALIGCVMYRKYGYEDYLNGGTDLYKKKKLLSELTAPETVAEVKDLLLQQFHASTEKTRTTKKLVPKRNALLSRIGIPVLAAALCAAAFFLWQAKFQDIPYKDSVIRANAAYVGGNYLGTQQALTGYAPTKLDYNTNYILARAYVATEALTDAQKNNILQGLTLKTNAEIFNYWIYLGRLQFTEAIDIATRFGDNELLLFAYMKYEVVVKNDTTMAGDQKTALLSELDNKIAALVKARDEAAQAAAGTTP